MCTIYGRVSRPYYLGPPRLRGALSEGRTTRTSQIRVFSSCSVAGAAENSSLTGLAGAYTEASLQAPSSPPPLHGQTLLVCLMHLTPFVHRYWGSSYGKVAIP